MHMCSVLRELTVHRWFQDRPPHTKEAQIEHCEGEETAWGSRKGSMESMTNELRVEKQHFT